MVEMNKEQSRGISLLEVLLSIALIGILAVLSVSVYQKLQVRNDLSNASATTAQSLRRAQILSQAVDGDSPWGVKVISGSIIIFKGSSYAARDANFDEVNSIPDNIVFSGISELVFSKLDGLPSSAGAITLTNVHNESSNLTINSRGMVEY